MNADASQNVLVFAIETQRFALPLAAVERVIRAVEVTPVPGAPDVILGVINLQGRILPVINTRKRLGLAERELRLDDHLIVAHTAARAVALVVDEVCDVSSLPHGSVVATENIAPGTQFIRGVARLDDSLVLIKDLEQFLSPEEEKIIAEAFQT
jgi:purine-binding chemotaxis protein CheW